MVRIRIWEKESKIFIDGIFLCWVHIYGVLSKRDAQFVQLDQTQSLEELFYLQFLYIFSEFKTSEVNTHF